jgi:predicted SAM-dependent methyltransferase
MGLRERIRTSIPGSTEFYEESLHKWKARGTPAKVRALVESGQPIHLDIGAGDTGRPGWVTLDITDGCDLYWDLRRGIPFPDASVQRVYSSHLFEHMDYDAGQALLAEVRRVLVPGGEVSVCVPNARLYIDAYLGISELSPDHDFWEPALNGRDGISLINYVAYMGGEHKCLFDRDSLLERLRSAGFVDVEERDFDSSIDLPEREFESIYAKAGKPSN